MPFSYAQYPGNGSTVTFSVPFPYLLRAHVKLYYGLNLQSGGYTQLLVDGVNYSWTSATQVQLTAAPVVGQTLSIRRETPTTSRLVDWSDGSALTADALDTADLQNFYAIQEQRDYVDAFSINPNLNVADGAITASKLSSNAVTSDKIDSAGIASSKLAFGQSGAGAVTRTVESKLRDVVSVKDFGAAGDGVTNDTAAIQAAVNACAMKTIYFPAGTYIVHDQIVLISNTHLQGEGERSVLKLATKTWNISGCFFAATLKAGIEIQSLTLDGNKGYIGTARSPLVVFYRTQDIELRDCTFRNAEGICVLASTDIDDARFIGCRFLSCGGNPDNTDGYRKQAIAFDNDTGLGFRNTNAVVENCYFYRQGLDCVSIAGCDNVAIRNNVTLESYTLLYTNPLPYVNTNIVATGNVVNLCSEFGAATAVPPLAFDMCSTTGLVIANNTINKCDTAAIGIFSGNKNVLVTGNVITDPMRMPGAGIRFCGIEVAGDIENVRVSNNLIVDTSTPSKTAHGIVVKSNLANASVSDNVIRNTLTSRYGYYTTNPFLGSVFAFTDPTQVSNTTHIIDIDEANRLTTEYGGRSIVVNTTSAAFSVSQNGTGSRAFIGKPNSPLTAFEINSNGLVGVNVAPALLGAKFTLGVNDAGITPFQFVKYGADTLAAGITFNKTRNASPYSFASVNDGDFLGLIEARGDLGAGFVRFASIEFQVSGTPGASSAPGSIHFSTCPSGSTTVVKRLTVKDSGPVRFLPQTAPGTAQAGDVYYDSATNKLRCHNGTTWNDLF